MKSIVQDTAAHGKGLETDTCLSNSSGMVEPRGLKQRGEQGYRKLERRPGPWKSRQEASSSKPGREMLGRCLKSRVKVVVYEFISYLLISVFVCFHRWM